MKTKTGGGISGVMGIKRDSIVKGGKQTETVGREPDHIGGEAEQISTSGKRGIKD